MAKFHKKAGAWVREIARVFEKHASFVVHSHPPAHYLEYIVEGKTPVILLPGITSKWHHMRSLGDPISLAGHPVYVVSELKDNMHDVPTLSAMLHEFITLNELQNVFLVGHSKGGLVGKHYLVHKNSGENVLGLVAIATPFSGSALSHITPHPAYAELRVDSGLVHELQTHTEINRRIISIFPEYDTHVVAEKGSVLENALQNLELSLAGHDSILSHVDVIQATLKALEKLTKMYFSKT
jgi:pimeloyl-ACP methyl ester carboxylesterase